MYRSLATPLQIPMIYGEDTIHGNAHMIGATMFPHDIGMGATRDPDLSYQQGVITAQETRSTGPHWGFGPTICAARDIRWGRTYECYCEEPALVNLMEPSSTATRARTRSTRRACTSWPAPSTSPATVPPRTAATPAST